MHVNLTRTRNALGKFLGLTVIGAILAAGYLSYRNKVMDRLYAEAMGYPPFWRSSAESQAAVKKLADFHGGRSTSMLLDIALANNFLVAEAKTEAMKALRKRKDPQVADALADLLQPHEGLETRQAAAQALEDLPCVEKCIRSIAHYLERVWRGELNDEDRWVLPPGNDEVTAGYKKGQQAVYQSLYSVLRREKVQTLTILVKVYGLGGEAPSPFALDLVSHLRLHEACPLLMQSDAAIQKVSRESYKAPRQELQDAITSLGCSASR